MSNPRVVCVCDTLQQAGHELSELAEPIDIVDPCCMSSGKATFELLMWPLFFVEVVLLSSNIVHLPSPKLTAWPVSTTKQGALAQEQEWSGDPYSW